MYLYVDVMPDDIRCQKNWFTLPYLTNESNKSKY